MRVERKMVDLEIIDVNGEVGTEDLISARSKSFSDADAFLICVSENDASSFEDVPKWATQIRMITQMPILLVLTKYDDPTNVNLRNGKTIADLE